MMRSGLAAAAAGLSAALASVCCIGPLALAAIGVGGAGVAASFAPYRPYLLGATALLLGLAFYLTYRPPAEACASEGTCAPSSSRRRKKTALWTVTILAVGVGAFPYLARLEARSGGAGPLAQTGTPAHEVVTLEVKGMTCGTCALHVRQALEKVPGVAEAEVSFEEASARVALTPEANRRAVVQAVEGIGYRARLVESSTQGSH